METLHWRGSMKRAHFWQSSDDWWLELERNSWLKRLISMDIPCCLRFLSFKPILISLVGDNLSVTGDRLSKVDALHHKVWFQFWFPKSTRLVRFLSTASIKISDFEFPSFSLQASQLGRNLSFSTNLLRLTNMAEISISLKFLGEWSMTHFLIFTNKLMTWVHKLDFVFSKTFSKRQSFSLKLVNRFVKLSSAE